MALNQDQIQQYHRDGFLLLPALIDATTLNRLNQRFLDIVDGAQPCSGAMKIMRDVMVVKGVVEPETPLHGVNKLFCLEDDPVLSAFAWLHLNMDSALNIHILNGEKAMIQIVPVWCSVGEHPRLVGAGNHGQATVVTSGRQNSCPCGNNR